MKDIQPLELPSLDWTGEEASVQALENMAKYSVDLADSALKWYFKKRHLNRVLGRVLLCAAIICGAAAGMIPVVSELSGYDGTKGIPPGSATVALGLAALFVAIDKFWGFTGGWIRYIQTGQRIGHRLETFRIDWERARQAAISGGNDPELLDNMFNLCEALILQVHAEVRAETDQWSAEFQSAIKAIAARQTATTLYRKWGTVAIRLSNADLVSGDWELQLNKKKARKINGFSAVITHLEPGTNVVRVSGCLNGMNRSAEYAITITAGEILRLEAELE